MKQVTYRDPWLWRLPAIGIALLAVGMVLRVLAG